MKYFPGIPDSEFIRGDIPMTKQEIRILVMAKAKITPSDTIIDIGAGTGSLSIEAALQATTGKVYAIERHPEGIALITANAEKFTAGNLTAITGSAPEALQGLPAADVIIVGGSGGNLADILADARQRLKPGGRLIITAIVIETLAESLRIMQADEAFDTEACGVQISRIKQLKNSNMLSALNPIYIIACTKKEQEMRK